MPWEIPDFARRVDDPYGYSMYKREQNEESEQNSVNFFLKFLKDTGPLIPLFLTSGDVSSGFQSLIRT